MPKIFQVGLACAIAIALMNCALAAEFDPIADAANSDTLLGLDLPTDFGDLESMTIPATVETTAPAPVVETPTPTTPESTTKPTTTVTPAVSPVMVGSGGAIDDTQEPAATTTVVTKKTTTTTQALVTPQPSSLFSGQIASAATVSTTHDYSVHSSAAKSQLVTTGPAGTLAFAFATAIGLTIFIRRKMQHA